MKILQSLMLAGLVGLMAWTGAAVAAQEYTKQKVVYHINGDDAMGGPIRAAVDEQQVLRIA